MKLSKDERKKVAKVFLQAKAHLLMNEDDRFVCNRRLAKHTFICLAISDWSLGLTRETRGQKLARDFTVIAREIVMSRIQPHTTACDWLREKVGDSEVDAAGFEQVQMWRARWLDALAKEFSK